jgi:hypothetical protein
MTKSLSSVLIKHKVSAGNYRDFSCTCVLFFYTQQVKSKQTVRNIVSVIIFFHSQIKEIQKVFFPSKHKKTAVKVFTSVQNQT